MTDVKNEHYVPQAYLRGWANTKDQIWVFDKQDPKRAPFITKVRNVASEARFYDFGEQIIAESREYLDQHPDFETADPGIREALLNPQIVENHFSTVESELASVLADVTAAIDSSGAIPDEHKEFLAYYITKQLIRTPEFRRSYFEDMERVGDSLAQQLIAHRFGRQAVGRVRLQLNVNEVPYEHARVLFDPKVTNTGMEILLQHHWRVGVNTSDQPLFTSDHPVVMRSHVSNGLYGIGAHGIEICWPLSPQYALILLDERYFNSSAASSQSLIQLSPDNVMYYNSLQTSQAYRWIFSSNSDFSLAQDFCGTYPEVLDIRRKPLQLHWQGIPPMSMGVTPANNTGVAPAGRSSSNVKSSPALTRRAKRKIRSAVHGAQRRVPK